MGVRVHAAALGEKLRFATCGFVRAIVLRRSPASGVLCRLAEAPVRDAASAAETQLFKWPSKQELLNELSKEHQFEKSEKVDKPKDNMDPGARKSARDTTILHNKTWFNCLEIS